jgi:hypothetical protein
MQTNPVQEYFFRVLTCLMHTGSWCAEIAAVLLFLDLSQHTPLLDSRSSQGLMNQHRVRILQEIVKMESTGAAMGLPARQQQAENLVVYQVNNDRDQAGRLVAQFQLLIEKIKKQPLTKKQHAEMTAQHRYFGAELLRMSC